MRLEWASAAMMMLALMLSACSGDKGSAGQDKSAAAGASSSAPATTDAPAADARLVVAFGDSLYAGYQLGPDEGLAPALQRALAAQGVSARVHNAGVSGDTTAAGLARLAFTLDGMDRKPDLVLVGLGGNDMLRGLSPEQTRANLDAILAELARRKIPAMLTGMLAAPNMGKDYGLQFNAIYPDLARKHKVPLYPFLLDTVVARPELLLADGIHPNAQGAALIAQKLAPQVAGLLVTP